MSRSTEYEEFDQDLRRIEELIRLVIGFRSFGAQSGEIDINQSDFLQASKELHKASDSVRTDLPIQVGSLLLYACGRFEYFVGQLVRAAADRELAKAGSYANIPKELGASLRDRLLNILGQPGKYSYLRIPDRHIAETLSKIVQSDENEVPSDIPTEILASTDANMRPKVLKEVFERVGMKDVWADISKQAPLRTHFDATSESECKKLAIAFLEDLMSLRNSIAHPTSSLNFPSPEKALEMCASLRALGKAISDVAYLPR